MHVLSTHLQGCRGPVQEADLAIKEEPYTMRVPRSQRGGEVIEPLVREQWFVRMQPLAEPALKVSPSTLCSWWQCKASRD